MSKNRSPNSSNPNLLWIVVREFKVIFKNNFLSQYLCKYSPNMSKLYRNLFIILAISPFLTLADLKGVKCVDCNSVTGSDCPVRTRGYMCLPSKEGKESWLKHEYSNFSDDPLETDDLDVCIPDGITIKSKAKFYLQFTNLKIALVNFLINMIIYFLCKLQLS